MPTTTTEPPIEEFTRRREAPAWARTAEWDTVPAQLRRRAFFSAAVADARALSAERDAVAALLRRERAPDGRLLRRDMVIRDMRRLMQARGLDTGAPDALTNPAAEARIKLVIDTNRAQAQGYARFRRSSTGGALLAFPAQELVRVRRSTVERPWLSRWNGAGGTLVNGRMVALKTDPIWTALSRFGTPYPPFDFNSGMGVRDVSRREAIRLGLIAEDWSPPTDPVADFNAGTEADASRIHPDLLAQLTTLFGDQVTRQGNRLRMAAA